MCGWACTFVLKLSVYVLGINGLAVLGILEMWRESLFLLCLTICISCPVPIIPEIKYSWVFNGQRSFLRQDARRFISQKTGNLYIAKVEASDAGNYTCAVRNMMTNSTVFSSPTPVVVRRDGEHHHHQSALWLSVYEINHLSELVVTCATALGLLLCFKWYDFPFMPCAVVMGEYEPKIEVQFPDTLHVSKGSSVKLECFALGK